MHPEEAKEHLIAESFTEKKEEAKTHQEQINYPWLIWLLHKLTTNKKLNRSISMLSPYPADSYRASAIKKTP